MNVQTVSTSPLVSLVGPPNSGKTTLFNYLSGKNYKTVNYPGATVEYSVSRLLERFGLVANVVDTPGIISLLPGSPDEAVSINSLYSHPRLGTPDVIVVTVDASQLSRHLLLVKQLISCKFNVVIALTMLDILKRKDLSINSEKLAELLDCPVVEVDPRTGNGVDKLISEVETSISSYSQADKYRMTRLNGEGSFKSLLKLYREIEIIENAVLIRAKEEPKVNLTKANKQLKILVNRKAKIECKQIDRTTLKIDTARAAQNLGNIFLFPDYGGYFYFYILARPTPDGPGRFRIRIFILCRIRYSR